MSKKNQRTECSGLEWPDFLFVIESLKRKQEYRFLLMITAGVYLGIRANEILNLTYDKLIQNEKFELTEKKTGKRRIVTVNPALKELAEFVIQRTNVSTNNFISANREGKPMSIQYFNRKLCTILKECNVVTQNYSSHLLRKSFGKRVWEINNKSEASLIMLSKIFNHSSISITRLYLGITSEEISSVFLSL
jgi:integrase